MDPFLLFVFRVCLCDNVMSVPYSLTVTCCERADPMALLNVMFNVFLLLFHNMVSQGRCIDF